MIISEGNFCVQFKLESTKGLLFWLSKTLTSNLWAKLRSMHNKVLTALKDYKKKRHRTELDKNCKRATPKMWSAYISMSTEIKIIRDGYPVYLKSKLQTTLYTDGRKRNHGKFYDGSKGKIGRDKVEKRLEVMDNIECGYPNRRGFN